MERIDDGNLAIIVAGPAGFANNIYIVADTSTGESAFVDAPDEVEKSIAAAEESGFSPSKILLTHSHPDHTAGIAALKAKYGCALYADARELWIPEGQAFEPVAHGDHVTVGNLRFDVISVPGHTPGSTTYKYGDHAFVGDTLFPGGPGRTETPENLRQEIESIVDELFTLPPETHVWPGHGDATRIDVSHLEYEVFAARDHNPELCGDVSWLES